MTTIRNSYISEEESQDDEEVEAGIERESWNELTITVVNGTHTIVTYSVGDSFSYSNSLEWDDSAQEASDANTGAGSGESGGDQTGNDSDDDEGLDTDRGSFEASMSSSSFMTISFQDYLVTMEDGTINRVISLNYGKGSSFEMSMSGGYEVADADGEMVDLGDDEGSGENGADGDAGNSAIRTSFANDIIENQNADLSDPLEGPDLTDGPEPGGDGHDIGAESSFTFKQNFGEGTNISVGAMFPSGGSIDDAGDADFFGHLNSSLTAGVEASGSDSISLGIQATDSDAGDGETGMGYIELDYGQGGEVGAGFNFGLDIPFGIAPPTPDGFEAGNANSDIPLPPVGPQKDEVELGFGVSMKDIGNSTVSLNYTGNSVITNGSTTIITETGIVVGNGSNYSYNFIFGLGGEEDEGSGTEESTTSDGISLGVKVTFGGSQTMVLGQTVYTKSVYPDYPGGALTIEYWDHIANVHESGSSISVSIGFDDAGEIEAGADATFSLTSTKDTKWINQVTQKGPDFNNKSVYALFSKVGTVITQNPDGTLTKLDIDISGWERFSIGAGTNPATSGASEDKSTTILLDAIQDSLDYVGMVAPGVGDALDMVNAAIHVARGNYGTAAVSLAAAVPFLGGAVMMKKLASKGGDVVAKASDDVAGALTGATGKLDKVNEGCQKLGSCFIAGTQVVVARAAANVQLAEVIPGQAHSVPLEVIDEKSLDAYYAAGALALGVGLSFKPRGKSPSKTNRRRRFWI